MILLSKAMDVERDHLIHRKRSPFPYEGKDLTRLKISENYNVERDTSDFGMFRASAKEVLQFAASEALPHGCVLDRERHAHFGERLSPSPCRGRGTALAGNEVIPLDVTCF